MIHVVGGAYFERCLFPPWNQLFGSAGRAAALISQTAAPATLHTYISNEAATALDTVAATFGFKTVVERVPLTYAFEYVHPLAEPRVLPSMPSSQHPPLTVDEQTVLRFGMIEGDAIVHARVAVFDPQSAFSPQTFFANGSTADHLAVVMNSSEATSLTGKADPKEALDVLLQTSEVAIIKVGAGGALIGSGTDTRLISAYKADAAFTIGSGDVFSAAFTTFWAAEKRNAFEAAELSSLAVAAYIESRALPQLDEKLLREPQRAPVVLDTGAKVYLAGPFFNLAQRWLVTEARALLAAHGLSVLSPLHDVGVGEAQDVAPRDIEMLADCDKVFAILDGSDEGTLFEVGYARAIGKPVICYTQLLTDEQLKMFRGTGCHIIDDFATAIALTTQR